MAETKIDSQTYVLHKEDVKTDSRYYYERFHIILYENHGFFGKSKKYSVKVLWTKKMDSDWNYIDFTDKLREVHDSNNIRIFDLICLKFYCDMMSAKGVELLPNNYNNDLYLILSRISYEVDDEILRYTHTTFNRFTNQFSIQLVATSIFYDKDKTKSSLLKYGIDPSKINFENQFNNSNKLLIRLTNTSADLIFNDRRISLPNPKLVFLHLSGKVAACSFILTSD